MPRGCQVPVTDISVKKPVLVLTTLPRRYLVRLASHDGCGLTGHTSMAAVCAVLFVPIRPRRRF